MAEKYRYRNNCLRVKVSDEELNIAKQKAEYCDVTVSEFIRTLILDGAIIKYDRVGIASLAQEINKIGVNINQIAKHINEKGGDYDKQELSLLIDEFRKMQTVLYSRIWGLD